MYKRLLKLFSEEEINQMFNGEELRELKDKSKFRLKQDDKIISNEEGVKHDSEKVRYELFPTEAIHEISRVLTFGAKKYEDWNWAKGMSWARLLGATFRHLFAWARGEDKDPESEISHLAHAATNICFLIYYEKHFKELDDRHKR